MPATRRSSSPISTSRESYSAIVRGSEPSEARSVGACTGRDTPSSSAVQTIRKAGIQRFSSGIPPSREQPPLDALDTPHDRAETEERDDEHRPPFRGVQQTRPRA